MLISHKYKFLCINIPKTATGTREAALGGYCELSLFNPEFKTTYGNVRHAPAYIAKNEFLKNGWDWDGYYKFTFVRNPFFRYISYYNMIVKQGKSVQNFSDWFASRISQKQLHCQNYYYNDIEDNYIILDKIYKYENLNESMTHIFKTVGMPGRLPVLNNPENAPSGGFIYDIPQYFNYNSYNQVIVMENNVINNFYRNQIKCFSRTLYV